MASFFNPTGGSAPSGVADDGIYRRQAAQQDAALAAMLAEQKASRDQQVLMGGSFADNAQQQERMARLGFVHDSEMGRMKGDYGLQGLDIANKPALGRLDLDKTKYANDWAAGASGRALSDADNALELSLVPKVGGAPSVNPLGAVFKDMGNNALVGGAYQREGGSPPSSTPASVSPSGVGMFGNAGGAAPAGGGPLTKDEAIAQYAALMRARKGISNGPTEQELYNRENTQDIADTQAFSTMAASADPRVRAIGIAGLQKTRAFKSLPAGTVQGLSKPLPSAGEDFLVQPAVMAEIKSIGTELAAAGNDTNAETLAMSLKPRVDRLIARAVESGADPNQVHQAILGQLGKVVPESSFYSNPISTTLGAIPGVRNFVDEPSRDAARRGIGL